MWRCVHNYGSAESKSVAGKGSGLLLARWESARKQVRLLSTHLVLGRDPWARGLDGPGAFVLAARILAVTLSVLVLDISD